MQVHGYSQVPVIENGEVLGDFSFRSFAQSAANATLDDWTKQKISPGDLPMDEFFETFEFARVTEETNRVFDAMDRDNGRGGAFRAVEHTSKISDNFCARANRLRALSVR
jgi:hypothetical protein